jgi:serine/threonine protein kinase
VSVAVASIVRRALAKDPNDRYPSAGAMRSALERAGVFPDEPDTTPAGTPEPAKAPATPEDRGPEEPPVPPSEPAPTTQRTPELARSSAPPRTSPSKPEVEIVPTSAERGMTPKPPSSRRIADSGSRNDTGSRSRASGPPTSRKSSPPKRDFRWVFAWLVLVGLGVAVGVVLGLR